MQDHIFKLLLIGDSGVGKSSILFRYADNSFTDSFVSTIGVDFKVKNILVQGSNVRLQIWDTAGQERFRTITSSYYRGAHGVILVYDVSDRTSFEHLNTWIQEIKRYTEHSLILVLGNKRDLPHAVQPEEAQEWARYHGLRLLEVSAKQGENLEEAFTGLVSEILGKSAKPKPQLVVQRKRKCF